MDQAIELEHEGYFARLNTRGARLEKLTFHKRNIIEERRPDPHGFYCGDVLAPWPNRIADGKYRYNGTEYSVPINEVERGNALHGLVADLEWSIKSQTGDEVIFELNSKPNVGYPFAIYYTMAYALRSNGLTLTLTAVNLSDQSAPFGASIHPYLVADESTGVNSWSLKQPADTFMEVDSVRLLPLGIKSVENSHFDFRNREIIGDTFIDHAFKVTSESSARVVEVVAPSGIGVLMEFDEASRWIQIHTADRGGDITGRKSLAVEPMSCPPDAFNSGLDLIQLERDQKFAISWRIQAIG